MRRSGGLARLVFFKLAVRAAFLLLFALHVGCTPSLRNSDDDSPGNDDASDDDVSSTDGTPLPFSSGIVLSA